MRWNKGQKEAITRRGGNLLVAAGAGAGKTAVLVERVIRRVTGDDATDITRLLVVTFTEAAAAEMRMRIGDALYERADQDPRAAQQAALLSQASISTLHSFCLRLIHRYFYRLGLDPQVGVMSDEESVLLKQELYQSLLEEELERDDGRLADLMDRYGGSGGQGLEELVLGLLDFARSHPRPGLWLRQAREMFALPSGSKMTATVWVEDLLGLARTEIDRALEHLAEARVLAALPGGPAAYEGILSEDDEKLRLWREKAKDWSSLRGQIQEGFSWRRLPPVRGEAADKDMKEACRKARDEAKKALRRLTGGIWVRPEDELLEEVTGLYSPMSTLVDMVEKLQRRYRQEKTGRSQLDFADLEHYCLALLVEEQADGSWQPSAMSREIRAAYDEVLVDEYQDINAVQDAILTLVSRQGEDKPNLFMVGDVKQSIYRFRLADPGLFLSRHRRYAQSEDPREHRVDLVENYRSSQCVIDAVNYVFSMLMQGGATEITYDERAHLVKARQGPQASEAPVEFHLLEKDKVATAGETDDELESLEKEAYLAGRLIQRLVRGQEALTLYDSDGHGRRATYKDVVILMRSTRQRANQVIDILGRMGIPAHAELGTGYFAAQEVAVMRSLLNIIDNPRQDIPLASVLLSPMVGMTPEQLAHIRLGCPDQEGFYEAVDHYVERDDELARQLQAFLSRLDSWRTRARRQPVNHLVWHLLSDTGYYDYCATMPGGEQRQANLRALYERARQFDSFAHPGLFRFLRFLDRVEEEHDLGQAPSLGPKEDVVRIMSVHKSKGLEFPVVVLLDAGKQFNLKDAQEDVLVHRQLGLGPRVVDTTARVKYPGAVHTAVSHRVRSESLAEELRVLYVAMTRARERLVIIGSVRDVSLNCGRWGRQAQDAEHLGAVRALSARRWLDWLGPCLMRHVDGTALWEHAATPSPFLEGCHASHWSVTLHMEPAVSYHFGTGREQGPDRRRIARLEPLVTTGDECEFKREIERRLGWEYSHQKATSIVGKVSVSQLARMHGEPDEMAPLFPHLTEPLLPSVSRAGGTQTQVDAMTLGNAVHTVLNHLPLKPLDPSDVAALVDDLIERELLLPEWRAHIPVQSLLSFWSGSLGQRLIRSEHAEREAPFTVAVPAGDLFDDEVAPNEWITVQGIIDCYFREGDHLVLIDYKTDRSGAATPYLEGYKRQLRLYGRALEQATGWQVREAYLVFLSTLEIMECCESS